MFNSRGVHVISERYNAVVQNSKACWQIVKINHLRWRPNNPFGNVQLHALLLKLFKEFVEGHLFQK